MQEAIGGKIRRIREPSVTTLPNPLSDYLKGHAKKGDGVEARVTRLELLGRLTPADAILDQDKVPAFQILHFFPMTFVEWGSRQLMLMQKDFEEWAVGIMIGKERMNCGVKAGLRGIVRSQGGLQPANHLVHLLENHRAVKVRLVAEIQVNRARRKLRSLRDIRNRRTMIAAGAENRRRRV